jgi:hypothetical protein
MRRSEFERAVAAEFGAQGAMLTADLVLPGIGMTADDAIRAGVPPREIWLALCVEADVPVPRRHGVGLLEPRRS